MHPPDFNLPMPVLPISKGDQIKAARKRLDMSQAELASRLGVAQSTVARWESGATPRTKQKDRAMSYSIASIAMSLLGLILMGVGLQVDVNHLLFGAGTGLIIYSTVLSLVPVIYVIDKHSTDEHNSSG